MNAVNEFTFDEDIVSDLHKDGLGFRPSQSWWYQWRDYTDAEKQAEWDRLLVALEQANQEEAAREVRAIAAFEDRVTNLMHGGTNRARVIAWLMDAEDVGGDVEFFEYKQGIPYGYLNKGE